MPIATESAAGWPARLRAACHLAADIGWPDDDVRRARRAPETRVRQAAVLVGVVAAAEPYIWFTERSAGLRHHPGQISFPGGSAEDSDESVVATALREAHEEIGLDPASVEVLGRLPRYDTVTGFSITPIVGWMPADTVCRADGNEVARLFSVPLALAMDAASYRQRPVEHQGQTYQIYSLDHGEDHIWGATAAMLCGLARRVAHVRGELFEVQPATG